MEDKTVDDIDMGSHPEAGWMFTGAQAVSVVETGGTPSSVCRCRCCSSSTMQICKRHDVTDEEAAPATRFQLKAGQKNGGTSKLPRVPTSCLSMPWKL
ncbi:GL18763 [Drosophila persimilis]|uniref:GL18763 n=1 Tax=Drosophila persimilis TaxID=7234 RepID=B4G8U4_DROPE|nr:GL18763 [Drosophila persimilis]